MNAPLHFKQRLADELGARAATLAAETVKVPEPAEATEATEAGSTAGTGGPAGPVVPLFPGDHRTPTRTPRRSPRRSPRRRPVLVLGAVAAAAAAAVTLSLTGSPSGTPGPHGGGSGNIDIATADYVVKSLPDGTVAVEVMNPRGIPGLQSALREAGIPAAVMTYSPSCRAKVRYDAGFDSSKVFPETRETGTGIDGHYSLIRPSAVPEGDHLLFVATTGPHGQVGSLSMSVVREVPACVPETDSGIGAGYVAPGTNP
ncbi:hypothetical protein ABZ990_15850 [Streptomyces sp. NPDC046203]|uniref:hypothetical protein n=1 Tax=Streptomyces sp. NPDC046203 TaxID=3154602 RepID=UPI0033E950E5